MVLFIDKLIYTVQFPALLLVSGYPTTSQTLFKRTYIKNNGAVNIHIRGKLKTTSEYAQYSLRNYSTVFTNCIINNTSLTPIILF